MSIDDPGWGGDSFGGGSGGAGGGGWGSPDEKPPRKGPNWKSPAVLGGGAAVLVIVIVVALVLSLHSSGSSKKDAVVTPSTAKTSTSASTSVTAPTTSAKPTPTKTVQTIASYDTQADAVCTKWKARVTAANDKTTTASELKTVSLPVLQGEVNDLKKVPPPATELTQQKLWLTQIDTVLNNLSTENVSAHNPSISTADTTAGDLGMKVCNYGY